MRGAPRGASAWHFDASRVPPAARLRARSRLRGPDAFRRALRGRHRRTGRWFAVMAYPNTLSHGRLGMIVSRRVAPRAVERNRLKRQIREVYRHLAAQLQSFDVVVQVQAPPPQRPELAAARAELTELLLAVAR